MHALVYQRSAAVQVQGATPTGTTVVLRWSIPFHVPGNQDGLAHSAAINQLLETADVGRKAILEANTKFHSSALAFTDQQVGPSGCDINRLLHKNVQTPPRRRYPLLGMHTRRTADNYHVQRLMLQEGWEVMVCRASIQVA